MNLSLAFMKRLESYREVKIKEIKVTNPQAIPLVKLPKSDADL